MFFQVFVLFCVGIVFSFGYFVPVKPVSGKVDSENGLHCEA